MSIENIKTQIATSFQDMDEIYNSIDHQDTESDHIFSVEIPVEHLKTITVRIIINKTLLENTDIESIKTSINSLIIDKVTQSRELFGEFHKIEKGHCAWVLQ